MFSLYCSVFFQMLLMTDFRSNYLAILMDILFPKIADNKISNLNVKKSNLFFDFFGLTFSILLKLSMIDTILRKHIFLDRAERHDLKSRLWIFFSPFFFPPKKRKKKRRMNRKIAILSHAFLLNNFPSLDFDPKGNLISRVFLPF